MPEKKQRPWFHWEQKFSAKATLLKFTPTLFKNLFSFTVVRGAAVVIGAVAVAGAGGVGAAEVFNDEPQVQIIDVQSSPNILVQIDEKLDAVLTALDEGQDFSEVISAIQALRDDLAAFEFPPGPPGFLEQVDDIQQTVDCIAAALSGAEVIC